MEIESEKTEELLSDRLGACEVCAATAAKYTCPKCEVKTCSLKCINIHKKELDCNGIRDPTKFITLDKFTNVDLLNDYRMLEQMTRTVEGLEKKLPRDIIKNGKKIIPKRMHKLQMALNDRKTRIHFLPQSFERHKINRSFYHIQNKEISWSIDWIFPNADNLKILEHGISENKKISSALHKYFNGEIESFYNEKLHFYQSSGSANVCYFLKAERVTGEKYFELDGSETLKNNLERKTIIEYPIIYVVLKEHSFIFLENCISNEEVDIKPEVQQGRKRKIENTANVVLTEILKEDTKQENKSKNLLFITEYSDAELSTDED